MSSSDVIYTMVWCTDSAKVSIVPFAGCLLSPGIQTTQSAPNATNRRQHRCAPGICPWRKVRTSSSTLHSIQTSSQARKFNPFTFNFDTRLEIKTKGERRRENMVQRVSLRQNGSCSNTRHSWYVKQRATLRNFVCQRHAQEAAERQSAGKKFMKTDSLKCKRPSKTFARYTKSWARTLIYHKVC